jgi:hypothetical protein
MENLLPTPFVDAIIADKFPQRQVRFQEGKETLVEGISNREIYNPDYVQAKDNIRWALDYAFHTMHDAIVNAQHTKAFEYFAGSYDYWDFSMSFEAASVPKQYRTLTKKFDKYAPGKEAAPEQVGLNGIYRYMDVLTDAMKMVNLLKEAKPFIVKGRKPPVLTEAQRKQQEADLKNTGICPVCMRRQKLTFDSKLVAHGYTIPRGWGGRNGMCMGHGYPAWELSPEGAIAFKTAMEGYLADLQKLLVNLQDSKSPTLSEMVQVRKPKTVGGFTSLQYQNERRTYDKGTPEYDRVRRIEIANAENSIRYITGDIENVEGRIGSWKAEPLMYGGAETQERWKSRMLKKEGQ